MKPILWAELAQEAVMDAHTGYGWCITPNHPRYDHLLGENCIEPVTDAELTQKLMLSEAMADKQVVTYDPAAAFVAEHRPY